MMALGTVASDGVFSLTTLTLEREKSQAFS